MTPFAKVALSVAVPLALLSFPGASATAGPVSPGLRTATPTLPAECTACQECFGENYFKGTGTPCQVCHGYKDTRGDCGQGWCASCTDPEEEQEDIQVVKDLALALASSDPEVRLEALRASNERLAVNPRQGTVLILGGCTGTAVVAEVPMGDATGLAGTLHASGVELRRFEDLIPFHIDGQPTNVFGTMSDVLDRWAELD